MSQKIKEILEHYWIDCNNTPTDGTIYDPIGVLTDQAHQAIISAILEKMPKEKAYNEDYIDNACDSGFNQAIKEMGERIREI